MIRCVSFEPTEGKTVHGGAELYDQYLASDDLMLWVDIDGEEEAVSRSWLAKFDIHPMAVQDALRSRHPPKVEEFDNFLFVLLRGLDATTSGINFGVIQLSVFVGERFIVTYHAKPSTSANWLYDKLVGEDASAEPTVDTLFTKGPSALLVALSNRLVRRYVEILLELEPRLDDIEHDMFQAPNDALLSELTGYKSRLRNISRINGYHERIADSLRDGFDLINPALRHEIIDMSDQAERTVSLSTLQYNIASDLVDGYLALTSHRLNRVMQILTVITVIFVPLTFIAGIYGMNFEHMPELSSPIGYFVVIGIMLIAVVVQLLIFRRKRWL